MDFYIVIPAHNEEEVIALMLTSLVDQTYLPKKVVVVDDNSTDNTLTIVEGYAKTYDWISVVQSTSSDLHIPGSKVIDTFYKGFETLVDNYDVICKFDADIILPDNYLERISTLFKMNKITGIAGGLVYIKKNDEWVYESIANKNHIRGPIKAYRKACFNQIGGLKRSIGWDTVDVLLAQYNGWKVVTDKTLIVRHLKPTGANYTKSSKYLQGEALYKMRYGFTITLLTALKMAIKKKSLSVFINYLMGFFKANSNKLDFIVTKEEGQFIRKLRWKGVLDKLF